MVSRLWVALKMMFSCLGTLKTRGRCNYLNGNTKRGARNFEKWPMCLDLLRQGQDRAWRFSEDPQPQSPKALKP